MSRARTAALTFILLAAALLGSAAAASAATPLRYFGGPVVHSAHVVLVEWGPDVRSSYTNPATGDPAFFGYLSKQSGTTTDIGGVLAQYMDTTRHNTHNSFILQKTVQISPSVAPAPGGKILDAQIQTVLKNQIGSGALPPPAGKGLATIYVLLFPPNDNVCFDSSNCAYGNSGFCAYHGSFKLNSSTQVLYAPIVDNGPGTPNYGGCGPGAASDLGNQTAVVSHEMSEAINDPLDNVASWYDYKANGEIADKCDAQPPAQNGPWTVESLWSNRDGKCEAGEPVFHAPTASFVASSTATAGQPVSFSAATSTDPSGNADSALDQTSGVSYRIASGIVAYVWNWGDGSTPTLSSAATASHRFAQSGNYQVSLTVTDALGFTSTETQEISVSGASGSPLISTGKASGVSDQAATLNGTVNPQGQSVTYHFAYGTDPSSLSQSTRETPGPTGQTSQPVNAQISGLAASTRYYYELVVTAGARTSNGGVMSFTTNSSSPPPTAPVVITGPAQTVSAGGARLTGSINPEGLRVSYYFRYGTSSLTKATVAAHGLAGRSAVPVSASITGLSAGTRYHFKLVATARSTPYRGAERSFTTALPLSSVITGGASNITNNSATVSGRLDPRGTSTIYQAQYGTTKRYGHSTTWIAGGSKNAYEHVSLALFGLQPSTTYHYRLVAQNKHGTSVGADRVFATAGAPNSAPEFQLTAAPRTHWSSLLAGQLRARLACSGRCVAHLLLAAEPAERVGRGAEMPMTLARAQATLPGRGSSTTALRLSSRFQYRLRHASRRPSEVVVMGYATAPGALASAPVQAVIRLSG